MGRDKATTDAEMLPKLDVMLLTNQSNQPVDWGGGTMLVCHIAKTYDDDTYMTTRPSRLRRARLKLGQPLYRALCFAQDLAVMAVPTRACRSAQSSHSLAWVYIQLCGLVRDGTCYPMCQFHHKKDPDPVSRILGQKGLYLITCFRSNYMASEIPSDSAN